MVIVSTTILDKRTLVIKKISLCSITCRLMARFRTRFGKGCGLKTLSHLRLQSCLIVDTTMQNGRMCKLICR
jgi:hypothetical protein